MLPVTDVGSALVVPPPRATGVLQPGGSSIGGLASTRSIQGWLEYAPSKLVIWMLIHPSASSGTMNVTSSSARPRLSETPRTPWPSGGVTGTSPSTSGMTAWLRCCRSGPTSPAWSEDVEPFGWRSGAGTVAVDDEIVVDGQVAEAHGHLACRPRARQSGSSRGRCRSRCSRGTACRLWTSGVLHSIVQPNVWRILVLAGVSVCAERAPRGTPAVSSAVACSVRAAGRS